MDRQVQQYLDEHFEKGKSFLLKQEALLAELAGTFEEEIWDYLDRQALFKLGKKMALPTQPSLSATIARQILFIWGLGYAVGSANVRTKRPCEAAGKDRPFPGR